MNPHRNFSPWGMGKMVLHVPRHSSHSLECLNQMLDFVFCPKTEVHLLRPYWPVQIICGNRKKCHKIWSGYPCPVLLDPSVPYLLPASYPWTCCISIKSLDLYSSNSVKPVHPDSADEPKVTMKFVSFSHYPFNLKSLLKDFFPGRLSPFWFWQSPPSTWTRSKRKHYLLDVN